MMNFCGNEYAVVFDDSLRLQVTAPTSCDVGYKYSVGIRRLVQFFPTHYCSSNISFISRISLIWKVEPNVES